jgi:hypothetical protein
MDLPVELSRFSMLKALALEDSYTSVKKDI